MEPFLSAGRRRRRLHSDEFKADAMAAASQPGVSLASVALGRSITANLLPRWVHEAEVPPAQTVAKPALGVFASTTSRSNRPAL